MVYLFDSETIKYCPYTSVIDDIDPAPHVHTFWEIVYPLYNDTLSQYVNEKFAEVKGGEFLIIKPNDIHRFVKPEPNRKIRQRNVFIDDAKFKTICGTLDPGLYDELVYSSEPVIVPFTHGSVETLESRWSIFSGENASLSIVHASLVGYYLGLYSEHRMGVVAKYPVWLTNLLEKMRDAEFLRKSVPEMIKETNYSHGFFCRIFKSYIGKTLVQYVLEERLQRSLVMLMDKKSPP